MCYKWRIVGGYPPNCTPHTPKSEGMIGHSQFAVMKDDVYFINISRGKVVDTEALTAALVSGKVRAAGLDVTDPDPPRLFTNR